MAERFEIDPDIRRARTLPSPVYADPEVYARALERVFAASWQLLPQVDEVREPGDALPVRLLPGSLDEPLVLTRDDGDRLHCLSNVCTHRAALVVESACHGRALRCRYHGRRFGLDGRFLTMPEFDEVCDFPSPADDLPRLPLERWGPLAFTALGEAPPFEAWLGPLRPWIDGLPYRELVFDAATSRDYEVRASWALYCDNYLEGFHIPFVHESLAGGIEWTTYRTETFEQGSLQVAEARDADDAFELPPSHPDAGRRIAAYYAWLFPNLMLNFYPWGLSLNLVEPLGVDRTRVRFLSWVADAARRSRGAGADLHRVEMEDEAVVESVQAGVRSRFYDRGRLSPTREQGVHHFHRLLAARLAEAP